MLLYLFYTLLYVSLSSSEDLLVTDSGIGSIDDDDIAMIFFVTLENKSENDFEVSICMGRCCDTVKPSEIDCSYMALIGGDMGILLAKSTKNVTLIYPNLYLRDRQGTCSVNIRYRHEGMVRQTVSKVDFNTFAPNEDGSECTSVDMDAIGNCRPVDCVVKYSGMRSYFDPKRTECVKVTPCLSPPEQCDPQIGYSIAVNNCIDLNTTIGKEDLQCMENGNKSETHQCSTCLSNYIVCHHGAIDSNGQCECDAGWTTTTDDEIYSPNLLLYHMCNIEVGAWNCVNKGKIRTTSIIIAVFAITIASKILILMCILNWCYKRYKHKKQQICTDQLDPDKEEFILCEDLGGYDECACEEPPKKKSHSLKPQTVNVSYYPCVPSLLSSLQDSSPSVKCNCSLKSDESIELSKTTSISDHVSGESESDGGMGEEELSGEASQVGGEEYSDFEEAEGEGLYGEEDRLNVARIYEQYGEQSDYSRYSTNESRRASSSSKSKSISTARKSRSSVNTK